MSAGETETSSQVLDWPRTCSGRLLLFESKFVYEEASGQVIPEASGIVITIMVVHAWWDAAD